MSYRDILSSYSKSSFSKGWSSDTMWLKPPVNVCHINVYSCYKKKNAIQFVLQDKSSYLPISRTK